MNWVSEGCSPGGPSVQKRKATLLTIIQGGAVLQTVTKVDCTPERAAVGGSAFSTFLRNEKEPLMALQARRGSQRQARGMTTVILH